jgi:hypothetical protein
VGVGVTTVAAMGLVAATGAAASQEDDGDAPPEPTDAERDAHRAAFGEYAACWPSTASQWSRRSSASGAPALAS